jgi:hypothetical protein
MSEQIEATAAIPHSRDQQQLFSWFSITETS